MPVSLAQFPRVKLGHAPTPLEKLDNLTRYLGGPEIWIKRDDCTGLAFGGNKTRKLEFLLGEALEQKADAIITFGALQSNHVRQTIAAGAKMNVPCHAILSDIVPHYEPAYRASGNFFLGQFSQAHVYVEPSVEATAERFDALMEELTAQGVSPYVVPTGGSSPTGALGYVQSALELQTQLDECGLAFDAIVSASASGGTQAGFALGVESFAPNTEYLGVNVYQTDKGAFEQSVVGLLNEVKQKLNVDQSPPLNFVHGFVGEGYGIPTGAMKEATKTLWRTEGILLDPVYTGKAMSALFALCREGRFSSDQKVLFLHTGGAPGLFAYADEFRHD